MWESAVWSSKNSEKISYTSSELGSEFGISYFLASEFGFIKGVYQYYLFYYALIFYKINL